MNYLRVKHILLTALLISFSLSGLSQKAEILVVRPEKSGITEWQILDGQYRLVISGSDFAGQDSVFFGLEADRRYLLQVYVPDTCKQDSALLTLHINGEPILSVKPEGEPGDRFLPFFTGVKKELSKIIGGTDASIADFPWQVYYESGDFMCGGSIIAGNWIITAAHCTENEDGSAIPVSEMFIKAGATNPYSITEGKRYQVSEVIIHENYNTSTLANDIALLRLKIPVDVPNARPVKLVTADDAGEGATDPGVISWVTGWGLTDVSPEEFPYVLQKVQLPIVSRLQASTVWRSIPDNFIMAGYRDAARDACNGDSGGPLVVPVSGEYRLAGITSWGSEDCDTYSAYTEISAFEEWIRTKTGITEFAPPIPAGETIICKGVNFSYYTVSPVTGATEYQWELFPEDAGTIEGSSRTGTVVWDPEYLGSATVKLRVKINSTFSEWSRLSVEVVMNTKILNQPSDRILCAGQTIDLSISAEGHNNKYFWYKDNVLITTLTKGDYSITGSSPVNSGIYKCKIEGSCGTLFTNNIDVTVHPLTRINYISPDITADSGEDITLEVLAEGHELTYQWFRNDEVLDNSVNYSLGLPGANASDIGLYQAIVKGTCGTELSSKTYLYIRKEKNPENPEVFIWPTVTEGILNTALSNDEIYSVRIFGYTGKILMDLKDCRYQTIINMDHYPRGVYIIRVFNRNFRWTQKFIKQ